MDFLFNSWQLAGWASELPEHGVLARRLLDVPVALFRDAKGMLHAIHDRCPHRFAPLSMGRLEEGRLICGYHGLAFDGTGTCVDNPHGPIVSALCVTSYPVREGYKGLWVWLGDPALAQDAALPDFSFVDATPDTAFSAGYIHGEGNYQLYVDNLLDLTHVDYMHPTSLGGGSITRTKPIVEQDGDRIAIKWHPRNEVPSPIQRGLLGLTDPDARVDSRTEVYWSPPSAIALITAVAPAGAPRPDDGARAIHILTPETANTTHYFFATTRGFDVENLEVTRQIATARMEVFNTEDRPMIVAQSRLMAGQDFWAMKPVLLPIDNGAVRVRRKLEQLIAQERKAPDASLPAAPEVEATAEA
ncbi:aromatic ring-hydroxylating dioxygenase subunit alpha [Novosphingobium terrae]|uniref:aromatic ring-hydroxylating dioxygenase subunit alpha n=1 Tax=Novosphingobium terrae TaxID=2726189 RepID=UPI0019826FC4|nr:aromatic ring-hydroxylating dioxygenase subunit alpha [Novosphingobium terrae]